MSQELLGLERFNNLTNLSKYMRDFLHYVAVTHMRITS